MEGSFFEKVLRASTSLSGRSDEAELESVNRFCSISEAYTLEGRSTLGKVTKVLDGDSLRVAIPTGGQAWTFPVRIENIDCPEVRTRHQAEKVLGLMTKKHVESLVLDKIVALKLGEFDKFGRLLAKVYTKEGVNVAEDLIERGLAVEYNGGERKCWGSD